MNRTKPSLLPFSRLVHRHVLLLALQALLACAPEQRAAKPPLEANVSRCDVFVRSHSQNALAVQLTIDGVELREVGGSSHALQIGRGRFSSTEVERRLQIAGAVVPPGDYEALVVHVAEAALVLEGGRRYLVLASSAPSTEPETAPAPGEAPPARMAYEVPVRFSVRRHDAVSIFLEWDVDQSVQNGTEFRAVFAATLEAPQVRLNLLYVADSGSGTVAALNRFTGQVVGTAKVGARPQGVAISPDRQRLYVANAGDGSVSVVDLSLNFAVSTIPIRLGAGTSDVALIDDGTVAAATNPGLDTVSLFDARTFVRLTDVRVGRSPIRVVALPGSRRVAVVNSQSNDVTIIDTFSREPVASVAVEAEPSDIAVDRRGREIYVAHRISANLVVLDASSLVLLRTIHVGQGMTALRADRQGSSVFVARDKPTEIAVVDAGLSAVVRRIPISARVEALAQVTDAPLLYGAAPSRDGLIVVNTLLSREESFLPDGAAPFDVLAVQ